MNKSIKALIPVRGGSERVSDKNIRRFSGSNLLEIKIKQLKKIESKGLIDGVVVNTEDEYMLMKASSMKCETVERDPKYASSKANMSEVYENMAENFPADVVVYCNVTNPLVKDFRIERAIKSFEDQCINKNEFDSVNTCRKVEEFLWMENHTAMNYDPQNQPRSQDLPLIYALNFAVNIIHKEDMYNHRNIVGIRPCLYPISQIESIDIDTAVDFEIAQFLYDKVFK